MPPNSSNIFNVDASLIAAFSTALNAYTLPSWMTTRPAIVTNWPEIAVSTPCFSFAPLPGLKVDKFQGRNQTPGVKIVEAHGMLDISAWVNRDQTTAWAAWLRFMQVMVHDTWILNPTIVIQDYYTPAPAATPLSATSYRIVLEDLSDEVTVQDVNTALERQRMILNYVWGLRA